MSPYWIVGLIILLVFSSLYQVMPNKHQRLQATLRQAAAQSGLRTRIILKSFYDDPRYTWRANTITYYLPWQDKPCMERVMHSGKFALLLSTSEKGLLNQAKLHLRPIGSKARYSQSLLDEISEHWPLGIAQITAIEVSDEGTGIHWFEQGEVEDVKKIVQFLNWLQTHLSN